MELWEDLLSSLEELSRRAAIKLWHEEGINFVEVSCWDLVSVFLE